MNNLRAVNRQMLLITLNEAKPNVGVLTLSS